MLGGNESEKFLGFKDVIFEPSLHRMVGKWFSDSEESTSEGLTTWDGAW